MKSNFLNQHFRYVPNPFSIADVLCLCKCPKSYFVEKGKTSYRLSALIPKKPNDPGTTFSLQRVERNENPTTAAVQSIGVTDMELAPGDLNTYIFITGSNLHSQDDTTPDSMFNVNNVSGYYLPNDPIPAGSTLIGKIFVPAANMPVPIGDPIPNTSAFNGVWYANSDFSVIAQLSNLTVTLQRTGETEISVFMTLSAPTNFPADFDVITYAGYQFAFAGGGIFYDYTVTSDPDFPAQGDTTVEIFWSTDGVGNTTQEDETHTPEEWAAGVLMLSLASADDPTAQGWPEPVQIIAAYLAGGFSDRFSYRSDKPFIPIGFCDLSDYRTGNPLESVNKKWKYNIADSVSNAVAIQDFHIACQIAASREPGDVVLLFDTLYTSFEKENWYAYFENALKQCFYNQVVFTTPGMTQETLTAGGTALQALIADLVKQTDVYDMAKRLYDTVDMNLILPPGLYGIGTDDSYTQAWEDYKTLNEHYPYLVVLQLLP